MPDRAAVRIVIPSALALTGAALLLSGFLRQKRRVSFRGASVVITGGSRGLGLELARVFAAEGARLTLLARSRDELNAARRDLIALGGYVIVHECDIRNRDEVDRVVGLIVRERRRIDVLINNAGILQVGPFENMGLEDFEEQMAVHVRGPLHLMQAVTPIMKRQGRGRIVNISSIGGVVAIPHLVPYSSAKFALTGLSDGVRAELAGSGIRVTTVVPGLMRTGSHGNALFKGRHTREYNWFAGLLGVPFLSLDPERTAHRIVEACRTGDAYVAIGGPARIAHIINALAPKTTALMMNLAARTLPPPTHPAGDEGRTGWATRRGAVMPRLARRADRSISRRKASAFQPATGRVFQK
jgi:NAD(P)-dependent dehydrogenase (short-subunit alcohol dehydrogenase family)